MKIIISSEKKDRGFELKFVNTENWICSKQTLVEFARAIRQGFVYDNLYLCVKKKGYENIKHLLRHKVFMQHGSTYLIPCYALPRSIFNNSETVKLSDTVKTAKVDDVLTHLYFYYDVGIGMDKDIFHIDRGEEYSVYGKFNQRNNYSLYVKCRGYEYEFEVTPNSFKINDEFYGGVLTKHYRYGRVRYIYIMPNQGLKIAIDMHTGSSESDLYYFCTDICSARIIFPSGSGNSPFYGDVIGRAL